MPAAEARGHTADGVANGGSVRSGDQGAATREDRGFSEEEEEEEEESASGTGSNSEESGSGGEAGETSNEEEEQNLNLSFEERSVEKAKRQEEMVAIEQEFAALKAKLYQHRLRSAEESLARLKDGNCVQLQEKIVELRRDTQQLLAVSADRRMMRLQSLEIWLAAEQLANHTTFKNNCWVGKNSVRQDLRARRRQLLAAKKKMDEPIPPDARQYRSKPVHKSTPIWDGSTTQKPFVPFEPKQYARTASAAQAGAEGSLPTPKRRRKHVMSWTGPFIVYMLSEQEIAEDMRSMSIGKAKSRSKPPSASRA